GRGKRFGGMRHGLMGGRAFALRHHLPGMRIGPDRPGRRPALCGWRDPADVTDIGGTRPEMRLAFEIAQAEMQRCRTIDLPVGENIALYLVEPDAAFDRRS